MSVAADHTGPWTAADVRALPEDRTARYELAGESLVMSPAPGIGHQRASLRLAVLLHAAAAAAEAPVEVVEAINVFLPSGLAVPDLVVADAAATAGDRAGVDADGVQLVIELVSPGSRVVDRALKPMLYAEAAIPHFWCLELDPTPMLVVHELEGGRYVERTTARAGATAQLDAPLPVAIDPAGLSRQ